MAKRIATTSINWINTIEKFTPEEKVKLYALKSVVDKYVREVASRPAELPKIDWNFYKSRISIPGMVESFQKSYESLKLPYPTDQGLVSEAEKANEKFRQKCEVTFQEVRAELEAASKKLAELEKMMPYVDMTMEEFYIARPDLKIDPDNPKLWPHHLIEAEKRRQKESSSV